VAQAGRVKSLWRDSEAFVQVRALALVDYLYRLQAR
jgi:hypothetical protein